MALPSWPASLPQSPQISGYEVEIGDGIIRTQMDSGVARTRVRSRDPMAKAELTFIMAASSLEIYKSWRRTRIGSGSGWFLIPVNTGAAESRIVSARETSPPRLKPVVGVQRWFVTIPIEYRDEVGFDEQVLDVVVLYGKNGVQDAAAIIGGADIRPVLTAWDAAF
jgi:hypothetical protein